MKQDFDLENKNGVIFIEPRTDGGCGVWTETSKEAKSMFFAMTQAEMIKMIIWLNEYIESQRPPKDDYNGTLAYPDEN